MSSDAVPQVRFGDWINQGWNMFTAQWKGWVTLSLGLFLVVAVPVMILMFFMYAASFAAMAGARGGGAGRPVRAEDDARRAEGQDRRGFP